MRCALVGSVALVALVSGCVYAFAPPDADGALGTIQVDGAYHRIGGGGFSDWAHRLAGASAVYVGPPISGRLARAITGPGLELEPVQPEADIDFVEIADASLSEGCELSVGRYRTEFGQSAEIGITEAQVADMRAGRIDIVQLYVECAG